MSSRTTEKILAGEKLSRVGLVAERNALIELREDLLGELYRSIVSEEILIITDALNHGQFIDDKGTE